MTCDDMTCGDMDKGRRLSHMRRGMTRQLSSPSATEGGAVTHSLSPLLISDSMSDRVSSPVTSYTGSPWGTSKKGCRV